MLRQRAEWRLVSANGAEHIVVADDIAQAVGEFEDLSNPVTQATRGTIVKDVFDDVAIQFSTSVTPQGAIDAKCSAYPQGTHEREIGKKVIFSAVEGTGWHFEGWFLDGQELSIEKEAELMIQKGIKGGKTINIEARFKN